MPEATEWKRDHYSISTDKARLQLERIHSFLSTKAYWSLGVPRKVVETAAANSLTFGIYDDGASGSPQIGYARVVTDYATFAWLCDVYIAEEARGIGLSKWLIETILSHPGLQGLRRLCLSTKDAHSLYSLFGFEVTKSPENWMEIKDNDIYLRRG